jgi:hypothetical protein
VFSAVKRQCYQPFIQHRESHRRAFEVTGRFREDCLAGEERLRDAGRDLRRPAVGCVVGISERDQSCSRMMRHRGMPDRFDARSSHAACSFVRRIVTV